MSKVLGEFLFSLIFSGIVFLTFIKNNWVNLFICIWIIFWMGLFVISTLNTDKKKNKEEEDIKDDSYY